jgi:hypothetical protein
MIMGLVFANGSGPLSSIFSAIGEGLSAVGSAIGELGRILSVDLQQTLTGIVTGSLFDISRGFGELLVGLAGFDLGTAFTGLRRIGFALIPRYGQFAGPNYPAPGSTRKPRDVVDEAAMRRDDEYGKTMAILTPRNTDADWALASDVFASQSLGPVGQVYRVALAASFLAKVPIQEGLGALGVLK